MHLYTTSSTLKGENTETRPKREHNTGFFFFVLRVFN